MITRLKCYNHTLTVCGGHKWIHTQSMSLDHVYTTNHIYVRIKIVRVWWMILKPQLYFNGVYIKKDEIFWNEGGNMRSYTLCVRSFFISSIFGSLCGAVWRYHFILWECSKAHFILRKITIINICFDKLNNIKHV